MTERAMVVVFMPGAGMMALPTKLSCPCEVLGMTGGSGATPYICK